MIDRKDYPMLSQVLGQAANEVLVLADVMGNAPVTLLEVMRDFLEIVPNPIIAGGFAFSHHFQPRGTVDIDVLSVDSIKPYVSEFLARGYRHETIRIPIGAVDMVTKGNKGVDFIHLDNTSFLNSIKSRVEPTTFLNQTVDVVSLEDLILLKMLAVQGRNKGQDRVDLENLLTLPHDTSYVAKWKKELGL